MRCHLCDSNIDIGDWPYCPHGKTVSKKPFPSFWDEHVSREPVYVDSLSKWNRVMKENKMELRDPLTRGEITARRDRAESLKHHRRHYE